MKNNFTSFFLIVIATLLSSCLSISTMQTGRTLGENNVELGINGSYGKYSETSVIDEKGDSDYKPLIAIRCQYGFSRKLDLGVKIDQTTFLGGLIKYQFVGDDKSRFASSIGLEAGFNLGAFLFRNLTSFLTIPLYLSYHPKSYISIYLTPRYLYTSEYIFASPNNGELGIRNSFSKGGSSYGIILGNEHKIALEISNFEKKIFKPTQFTIGYIFTF